MGQRVDREKLLRIAKNTRASFKYKTRGSTSAFPGEFKSPYTGKGVEFFGFREYQPGDDLSSIHPQETSRQGGSVPILSEYREQREVKILLVVDITSSMHLREKPYMLYAALCMLAFWAGKEYIPVGLWLIGDDFEVRLKPKQSTKHLQRVDKTIVSALCDGFENIRHAPVLERDATEGINAGWFAKFVPAGSMVFVLSDFLGKEGELFKDRFRGSFPGRRIVPVVVQDDLEHTFPVFPSLGCSVNLADAETGETVAAWVDRKSSKQRKAEHEHRFSELVEMLKENYIIHAHLDTLDLQKIRTTLYGVLRAGN